MDNSLTLIIPTYNEHDNIVPLVERVHSVLSRYDYRILFVDDNSQDGTAELIGSFSGKYPVEVIIRRDKRGLASAVVDGIAVSKTGIIGVMDADLQHPPEVLTDLLTAVSNGAGVAIGSRYVKGGGLEGWGTLRKIISKGATTIAHVLLPPTRPIKDPMSGFFMFRREVVAGVDLNPTGYKILLEVLLLGKYQHAVEVPYVFRTRSRGQSKLSTRQQIEYLKHVYSLMKRTGELTRFLKFILVGGSGIIVNQGLLMLLVAYSGMLPRIASPIAIETSIISNFLFNNFFTFGDRRPETFGATLASLIKYNIVTLAGAAINWVILRLLNEGLAVDYRIANLVGISIAFLSNYILSNRFAWSAKKSRVKISPS